jgi:hypothetical protein
MSPAINYNNTPMGCVARNVELNKFPFGRRRSGAQCLGCNGMKGRDERVWSSLHSGWLDGTKAVALIEGVAEIVGDLDEVFAIRRSCHCCGGTI